MEKTGKFCKFYYQLIGDERISFTDAALYSILLDKSEGGILTRKLDSISKLTGLSISTIKRAIQRLKAAGYIISTTTNGHSLTIHIAEPDEAGKPEPEPEQNPKPEIVPVPSPAPSDQTESDKKVKVKEPTAEELFEAALKAIERKNPKNAQEIFEKLKEKATSPLMLFGMALNYSMERQNNF